MPTYLCSDRLQFWKLPVFYMIHSWLTTAEVTDICLPLTTLPLTDPLVTIRTKVVI